MNKRQSDDSGERTRLSSSTVTYVHHIFFSPIQNALAKRNMRGASKIQAELYCTRLAAHPKLAFVSFWSQLFNFLGNDQCERTYQSISKHLARDAPERSALAFAQTFIAVGYFQENV
jgi:hypothetical protein